MASGKSPPGWSPSFENTLTKHMNRVQICLREAWRWSQLDHPNITPLLGLANLREVARNAPFQLCTVAPWATHGNIMEYIHSAALSLPEMFILLRDIAAGLVYLHSVEPTPFVHGGLNGNNVLVFRDRSQSQGRIRACLVDFGLSGMWNEDESTVDVTAMALRGNPRWLAWERVEPAKYGIPNASLSITVHSDVFEMMRTFFQASIVSTL
ncbi:kinase-like protein [Dacryopinax primogenitus]|uniref:Kinase-like protein n=1 Tax=Dacryopinax primogenitus (strain DJM 731) TaxID=1858805 RepID=M5FPN5_DACPD|nr:kinase-like protein [Dacryopinax primogenitus]EJT97188.1 kinase-like protein [Dacryopinax primogenitus]